MNTLWVVGCLLLLFCGVCVGVLFGFPLGSCYSLILLSLRICFSVLRIVGLFIACVCWIDVCNFGYLWFGFLRLLFVGLFVDVFVWCLLLVLVCGL